MSRVSGHNVSERSCNKIRSNDSSGFAVTRNHKKRVNARYHQRGKGASIIKLYILQVDSGKNEDKNGWNFASDCEKKHEGCANHGKMGPYQLRGGHHRQIRQCGEILRKNIRD